MRTFGALVVAACAVLFAALVIFPGREGGAGIRESIVHALLEDGALSRQAGDLSVSLWPRPRVTFADVRFGEGGEPWLRAASMESSVALWELLRGRIVFEEVLLVEADLLLDGPGALAGVPELLLGAQEIRVEPGRILAGDAPEREIGVERIALRRIDGDSLAVEGEIALGESGPARLEGVISEGGEALRARMQLVRGDVRWNYSGTLEPGALAADAAGSRSVMEGEISLEAAGIQGLLSGTSPNLPDAPLSAMGGMSVVSSGEGLAVEVSDLVVRAGDMDFTGAFGLRAGRAEIVLSARRLDLGDVHVADLRRGATGFLAALGDSFAGVEGVMLLSSDVVRLRDQQIRDGSLRVVSEGGALRIERFSARLPGGAELTLAKAGGQGGEAGALFHGDLAFAASDLQVFADWAEIDLSHLRMNLPYSFEIHGEFTMNSDSWSLAGFEAALNADRFHGSVARPAGGKGRLAVSLAFEDLAPGDHLRDPPEADGLRGRVPAVARLFSPLSGTGADIELAAERLHLEGGVVRGLEARASVDADGIVLGGLLVDDFAGAAFDLSGSLALPLLEGAAEARIEGRAEDARELLRELGIPFEPSEGSPLDASWTAGLEGGQGAFRVVLEGEAFGVRISAEGALGGSLEAPEVDLAVEARRGGNGPGGDPGAFRLEGAVAGGPESFSLSGVRIVAEGIEGEGSGSLDLSGPRPLVTAELGLRSLDPAALLSPASGGAPAGGAEGWSSEPVPLAFTEELDADLDLEIARLVLGGTEMQDVRGLLAIRERAFSVAGFRGRLGEGWLRGAGGFRMEPEPGARMDLRISNAELAPFRTETGLALVDTFVSGVMALRASGSSPLAMASSLEGSGWISLSDGTLAFPDESLDAPLALHRIRSGFSSSEGVLRLEDGVADMANLAGGVSGQVSFVDRTTDLTVRLEPAEGDEGGPTEVRVSGPWEALRGRFTIAGSPE